MLEDALYNGRQLNRAGLEKLVWASEAARNGSLDALQGQYRRITQELPPVATAAPLRRLLGPEAEVLEVEATTTNSRGWSLPRRPAPARAFLPPPPPPPPPPPKPRRRQKSGLEFLCRYSTDLQLSPAMPLAGAFDPGRGSRCPGCRARIPVDAEDMWDIEFPVAVRTTHGNSRRLPLALPPPGPGDTTKRDPSPGPVPGRRRRSPSRGGGGVSRFADDSVRDDDRGRSRTGKEVVAVAEAEAEHRVRMVRRFCVPARFVVKCHTPEGDYMCVLCCGPRGDYAGPVVLCDDPETLVHHVAKEHRLGEIEDELDIFPG